MSGYEVVAGEAIEVSFWDWGKCRTDWNYHFYPCLENFVRNWPLVCGMIYRQGWQAGRRLGHVLAEC